MPTVESYDTAKGKRYRVRYRTADNKQSSKRGFTTKKEASLWAADAELKMERGEFVTQSAGRITVGALAPTWLKKKELLKPSAYKVIEDAWRVYVAPKWADVPIRSIKPTAVEAWIAEVATGTAPTAHAYKSGSAKPKSASVTLRALGVLAGILDDAVKENRIAKNPARGAANLPKKISMKERAYLNHAEVEELAQAAPTSAKSTLIYTLSYCGLRWGEACALRVRDVSFAKERLNVALSATAVKREIHLGPVKSWEKRMVPVPSFLLPRLEELCAGKRADDLVFPDEVTGSYMPVPDLRDDRNGWWIVMLRAVATDRLTPHDLRHTCASLAVSAGANVKALQRMLGHKSAALTLDTYADLFDDDLSGVSVALDQARSRAIVSTVCPEPGSEASTAA